MDALGRRRNAWDFPLPRAQTTDHEPGSRLALFAKYVAYLSLLAQLKIHTHSTPHAGLLSGLNDTAQFPSKLEEEFGIDPCQFLDKGISYDSLPPEKRPKYIGVGRDSSTLLKSSREQY